MKMSFKILKFFQQTITLFPKQSTLVIHILGLFTEIVPKLNPKAIRNDRFIIYSQDFSGF
jgi:hypothetical protein